MNRRREKVLLTITVVMLLNLIIIPRINIGINVGTASPEPNIYVAPSSIYNSSKVVGETFTIDFNIVNAENLYGWQVNMTYNPAIVNTTTASIAQGNFLSDFGPTVFPRDVDNVKGFLLVACTFTPTYPSDGAYGDGWLASITFTVKAEGATLLHFVEGKTKLKTYAGGVIIDILNFTTEDGSFDNRLPGTNVLPVASFSVLPLASDQRSVVRFDASASYDLDDWLISYHWDYGDGASDTYTRSGKNLTAFTSHAYPQNGTYSVTLTVKDNWNQTATATAPATVLYDIAITNVNSPQLAVMPGTNVTIHVTVANNGDFLENSTITTYFDQNEISAQNVTNLAPNTQTTLTFKWNTTGVALGNYVLKANATTVLGEANTTNNEYSDGIVTVGQSNIFNYPIVLGGKTFIVQINSNSTLPPSINFISAEKKVNFTISGAGGTGGFCNVTIPMKLLNASSPSAWNVTFDANPWLYTATLNSTHYFIFFEYTHSSHAIEIVGETVGIPPIALFTPSSTEALAGVSISFDASASYDSDGTISSWSWDFGDGQTGSGEIVQHIFDDYGIYNVTLTVKDADDLENSTSTLITIIDYPTANFTHTPTNPIANQLVTFDATISQANGGTITSYSWDFGDGQTNTTAVVMHKYSSIGNYLVNLTVTDDEGLSNFTAKTVTVVDYPIANFTYAPAEPLVDHPVTFNATISQANGGTITSYTWTFGDGQTNTSTTAVITHSYVRTGTFQVQLTVVDSEQLSNSTTKTVVVRIHNVAVTSVTASKSRARIGDSLTITVKVVNQGNYTETFDITAYYNTTSIGTLTVSSLEAKKTLSVAITWDTTGVSAGVYTIKVAAAAVTDETKTDDNQLVSEDTVTIEQKESALTITAGPPIITIGENTTISGTLTPALQDVTITVYYKLQDATEWSTVSTTATTDADGQYTYLWTPNAVGKYQIKASWQGNAATYSCESPEQTIIVFEVQEQQQTSTNTMMLYAVIAVAVIILIATVTYFLKIRK